MKVYRCRKIENPFEIDGNIKKEAWNRADELKLVDVVTGDAPRQETCAKILYDDQYLYLAFSSQNQSVCGSLSNYNDLIYQEDVVELFISMNDNLREYVEIEINPINTILHYLVKNDLKGYVQTFGRVNETIDSVVILDEQRARWDVEMRIPMSEIFFGDSQELSGTVGRMNLYRIDRDHQEEDEFSSWNPVGELNYHKPKSFGIIRFE